MNILNGVVPCGALRYYPAVERTTYCWRALEDAICTRILLVVKIDGSALRNVYAQRRRDSPASWSSALKHYLVAYKSPKRFFMLDRESV